MVASGKVVKRCRLEAGEPAARARSSPREASKLLPGSKYVTLSFVMPIFIELFSYIMDQTNVQDDVKVALTQSHSVLSKYYEFSDDCPFYLASVILDPRCKAKYLIQSNSLRLL